MLCFLIFAGCFLLPTAGWAETPAPETAAEIYVPRGDEWRRTNVGWMRVNEMRRETWRHRQATGFHPALLAVLQVLLSLGALIAFAPASRRSQHPVAAPAPSARPQLRLFPDPHAGERSECLSSACW